MWDDESRQAIRDLFGLTEEDTDIAQMEVHRGERWTMRNDRVQEVFGQAGYGAPKSTDYLFCECPIAAHLLIDSLDGWTPTPTFGSRRPGSK